MPEREQLEVDVLIVGAGPAGLAAAIRLADIAKQKNRELEILVIEKAREVGAHGISGGVMVPTALRELMPDYRNQGFPFEFEVYEDFVYRLMEKEAIMLPVVPPPLRNEGNYIVSLAKVVRWLAAKAEERGVMIMPEFPGWDLLIENSRVVGVRTGDKGIDKDGKKKDTFTPGADIKAKLTVLSEGPRGHLTRKAVQKFRLDRDREPQLYSTGVKEVWEMPEGTVPEGRVIHTMGFPLDERTFGGSFLYSMQKDRWSVGFVVGLDYKNPFLDPHHEFQKFKTHPRIRSILEGGKMVEYGAKTIPSGGWRAAPKLHAPGVMLCGDSASLLNAMTLKGIHLGMKSGMLAAETALEALEKEDYGDASLSVYQTRVEGSYIRKELWKSRYFKHGFKLGMGPGYLGAATSVVLGGWSPFGGVKIEEGHKSMQTVEKYHGKADARPERIKFDGKLTFSKLDNLYTSGTQHNEDQPSHLKVLEPDICTDRCAKEYGNPCQHFCPASVYEWVKKDEADVGGLMINFSNCVHCKTCDIMDPYGIIRWVPPEGGGGPGWNNL